jgi:glycosyltransferase involved in cell wall biosynthesis
LKVLFVTHQASFNMYGGAETQMMKTLEHINKSKSGHYKIKLFDMWTDAIENYDIMHIFKPTAFPSESYLLSEYAKTNGVKVVVSPIYYFQYTPQNLQEKVITSIKKNVILSRKYFLKSKVTSYLDPYKYSEKVLKNSDAILPNTQEELDLLIKVFNIPHEKCHIIPNGVEIEFEHGDPDLFKKKYGLDDFILFVGRIEKRKNVLRLIKAFVRSGLDTSLVIIGKVIDSDYYELCKKNANRKVIFLPPLPHDSKILKAAYKAAKVVALPSDCETPGLVALEGGISGSNIVITKIGGTKEYFGEHAWYVNPSDEEDILNALLEAYNTPKNNNLIKHIEEKFTWDKVAEMTTDIYDLIT